MPTRKYDLLIFDWDGTLADSIGHIVASVRHAAQARGLEQRSDQCIRNIIGLDLNEAIGTLYPELIGSEALPGFLQAYVSYFVGREGQGVSPLFPGVEQELERLRLLGFRLAVATGKSRHGLNRALAGCGYTDYFEATRCADESSGKPDPRMLREILWETGVPVQRALMVGDASFDLQMARSIGMDAVAVSYGAQPLEQLLPWEPITAIACFAELRLWLERQ